jgi:hypothetical protein
LGLGSAAAALPRTQLSSSSSSSACTMSTEATAPCSRLKCGLQTLGRVSAAAAHATFQHQPLLRSTMSAVLLVWRVLPQLSSACVVPGYAAILRQ